MIGQGVELMRHVLPAVMKPIRQLWNEIVAFMFLALAVLAVPQGIRTAREFNGEPEHFFKLILIGLFVAIMIGYGISSYLRARKISRS